MLMFTGMTFYDALYNSVPYCGCFGKAITLSNWQTFYKNLVIDGFILILLFNTSKIKSTFNLKAEIGIASIFVALFLGFEAYNYRYLPVIDFLDWQVGAEVKDDPANGKFMIPPVFDADEEEVAMSVISGNVYIAAVYDLSHSNFSNKDELLALMDKARTNDYSFIFLTDTKYMETDTDAIAELKKELGRDDLDIYYSDDKSIKGLIRSNPGIILLENGIVKGKWSCRNIPNE
jgi:hypothetical protein